jgi:hypothetical protein
VIEQHGEVSAEIIKQGPGDERLPRSCILLASDIHDPAANIHLKTVDFGTGTFVHFMNSHRY